VDTRDVLEPTRVANGLTGSRPTPLGVCASTDLDLWLARQVVDSLALVESPAVTASRLELALTA
jgi:hypothetical protein